MLQLLPCPQWSRCSPCRQSSPGHRSRASQVASACRCVRSNTALMPVVGEAVRSARHVGRRGQRRGRSGSLVWRCCSCGRRVQEGTSPSWSCSCGCRVQEGTSPSWSCRCGCRVQEGTSPSWNCSCGCEVWTNPIENAKTGRSPPRPQRAPQYYSGRCHSRRDDHLDGSAAAGKREVMSPPGVVVVVVVSAPWLVVLHRSETQKSHGWWKTTTMKRPR
eukprot:2978106-Amphidinium_carterae.1